MLGTILLIGVIVFGYFNVTFWVLVPIIIIATFLGIHHSPEKVLITKERGIYWKLFFSSLPL
jgi:disulfide bond formation protein DsbB